jgi:hypothetical protein
MQRLRHPTRSIREPFGKAGLTVAILALVLAMVGGAWAAAGLNGKQKKEVTKIAKKYAGKPGPAGATGPAGANGTNGKDGANGTNGTPGQTGKSVVAASATATAGGECPTVGGTKFEVEGSGSPSHVCNGKNGTTGFTETLPSSKTERGTWDASLVPASGVRIAAVSTSFNIPLAAPLSKQDCNGGEGVDPANCPIHYILQNGKELITSEGGAPEEVTASTACPEPGKAAPGNLCLYTDPEAPSTIFSREVKLSDAGGVVISAVSLTGEAPDWGSWAVTAG